MWPELPAEFRFIELCDAHAVFISRNVLCHNVHGDLGEEEIRSDAGRRRDAGTRQDLVTQHAGEAFRIGVIEVQIGCHVDKAFIDGVDVHVLGADVFQIDAVDLRRHLHIVLHARYGLDVVDAIGNLE